MKDKNKSIIVEVYSRSSEWSHRTLRNLQYQVGINRVLTVLCSSYNRQNFKQLNHMSSIERARQMILHSNHLLNMDKLEVELAHPIEVKYLKEGVLTTAQVTYIARKSKEGRPRLFESRSSRPIEISHCTSELWSVIQHYHSEQITLQDKRELDNAIEQIDKFGITDLVEYSASFGYNTQFLDKEIMPIWEAYKNKDLANSSAAKKLLNFINMLHSCSETIKDLGKHPFQSLDVQQKKSLLYAQRCMEDREARIHYVIWADALRFSVEAPVLYHFWHSDLKDLINIFEKYGIKQFYYTDQSTEALECIAELIKAGYSKVEATEITENSDLFGRPRAALLMTKVEE